MEQYIQHIELINQYINGLLSKSDTVNFENKLATDNVFKATYNNHLIFLEGLKRKVLKTEIQTARRNYVRTKWIKYIGISIVVLVISALLFSIIFKDETTQIHQPLNSQDSIVVVSDSIVADEPKAIEILIKDDAENNSEVLVIKDIENKPDEVSSVKQEAIEVLEKIEIKEDSTFVVKPESLTSELMAFYKSVEKMPEIIVINNEKVVTITCKEGTKLTIPAKAFMDVNTGKLARGKINIAVTEYYKLSDMLLANLTTKSDDKMLETGGMLYVEANKKGSKLKLKSGKIIQITFPDKGKNNMQLFSGEVKNNQVNWRLRSNTLGRYIGTKDSIRFVEEEDIIVDLLEGDIDVPINIVEEVPIFPGCENGTQVEKQTCLQENLQSIIEKNFDSTIAEDLNLVGNHKIIVAFKININGDISDIEAFAAHTKLAQEAIRTLELVPRMLPAKQRGRAVYIPYSLPIYFSVGESSKNNPNVIKVKGKTTFERTFKARLNSRDSVSSGTNNTIVKNNNITANDVARYAFSTSQLGWINCDRFVKSKNRFKYKIKIKNAEGATIKMVFKSMSAILPSKAYQNEFDFGTIPANEEVTLVAIKEVDGQFYLAVKDTETKFNSKMDLEFKAVTINELKSKLRKLNESFD